MPWVGLRARQLHHGHFHQAPRFKNMFHLLGIRRRHLGTQVGAQDDHLLFGQACQDPAQYAAADTKFLGQLLRQFGITVTESDGPDGQQTLFDAKAITSTFAPYDLVRQMRASFNVLGPLLARTGEAKVSLPGGCTIGARPVDLHLQALTALGAEIELDEGYVTARAP